MAAYRNVRWAKSGDLSMRKATLLLAVLIAAAFSTTADAAKKKKAAPAPKQETRSLFLDAFQPWNTTYAAPAKPAKVAKKKAAKKKA
jgi:hypothetical protein